MPNAQTILDKKGSAVATIERGDTVFDAAKQMNEQRIGALIVRDGESVIGIFTERDILNRVVAAGLDPKSTLVGDVMTSPMACCKRDSRLAECRAVMSSKRIRHLPVVEDGTLYGMISAGDILASECDDKQETIEYLQEYLHGHR